MRQSTYTTLHYFAADLCLPRREERSVLVPGDRGFRTRPLGEPAVESDQLTVVDMLYTGVVQPHEAQTTVR